MKLFFALSTPWVIVIDVIIALVLIAIIVWQVVFTKKHLNHYGKHWLVIQNIICTILFVGLAILGIYITAKPLGYNDELSNFLNQAGEFIKQNLIRVVYTFIIIAVTILIINIAKVLSIKLPNEIRIDRNAKRRMTIAKVIYSLIKYAAAIIALIVTLIVWNVNIMPALAGLGILGIIVGLGAQRLINDFISGLFIVFEHHFDVGDVIEIDGFKGTVIDIGLKSVLVKNWKDDVKIFANGNITQVINYSKFDSVASVAFKTSDSVNSTELIQKLTEELKNIPSLFKQVTGKVTVIGLTDYNESGFTFQVNVNVKSETQAEVERYIRLTTVDFLQRENLLCNQVIIVKDQKEDNG